MPRRRLGQWRYTSSYTFLTSALGGSVKLTSRPGCIIADKEPRYLIAMRLGGAQNRSGRFQRRETILSLPNFEPRTEPPDHIFNEI